MATGCGAFATRGGYNQSGGANYIVVSADLTSAMIYDVPAGTGSGGAALFPAPIANSVSPLTKQWGAGLSSVIVTGSILKDMGKTYISSQRTFRKFQLVGNGVGDAANFGVVAGVAGRAFFLETMREGAEPSATAVVPLAIARYM